MILTRQPQYAAKINHSGLGAGIRLCFNAAAGPVNLAQKKPLTVTGTPGQAYGPVGCSSQLISQSNYLAVGASTTANLLTDGTTPFTLTWHEVPVAANGSNLFPIASFFAPGNTNIWVATRSNSASAFKPIFFGKRAGAAGVTITDTAVAAVVGTASRWMIIGRNGMQSNTTSDYEVYVDGVRKTTGASASIAANTTDVNNICYDTNQALGTTNLTDVVLWNRALSQAEAVQYFSNPYGIYAPTPARIYSFPSAAAGSIKTLNGLAWASVKTVNGVAVASIKTINGLAAQ